MISIEERRFYTPKILICGLIWLVLTISTSYFNINKSLDPTFTWADNMSQTSFYSQLYSLSAFTFVLYAGYFVIISYASLSQGTFRDMKKSYQFSLVMTLFVIAGFLSLMFI